MAKKDPSKTASTPFPSLSRLSQKIKGAFGRFRPELTSFGVIFLALAWYWSIATKVPPMADDYCAIEPTLKLTLGRLTEIYTQWSGRMVGHAFIFIENWLNEASRDVIAGLLWMSILAALIACVVPIRNIGKDPLRWAAAIGLFIASIPALGEILWWLSGVTNYLWTSLFVFVWLVPYARFVFGDLPQIDGWKMVGLSVLWLTLGLLAGNGSENLSPAAWLLAITWLGYGKFFKKQALPLWLGAGLLGTLLGIFTLLLAPGNMIRMEEIYPAGRPELLILAFNYLRILPEILKPLNIIIILSISLIVIQGVPSPKKLITRPHLFVSVTSLGFSVVAILALFAAPYVEPRSLTGPTLLMILSILAALEKPTQAMWWFYLRKNLIFLIAISGSFVAGQAFGLYELPIAITQLQEREYDFCREKGISPCPITRYPMGRDFLQVLSNFNQPQRDPNNWANQCRAKAEGIEKIMGIDRTFRAP
jgi:hypothetical protein